MPNPAYRKLSVVARIARAGVWLLCILLLPAGLSAQMILPTAFDLGFKQAEAGLQIRGNYVFNETNAGATELYQIRPHLVFGYNTKPRAPYSLYEAIGAKSRTGKKLLRYAVVDGASLRLGLPEAPSVDGRTFRPLELTNYDQYAFMEVMYKRRNIRKRDLGLYRLLNYTAGFSMSQHYMSYSALAKEAGSPGGIDENPIRLPENERFTSMTLTIGAEYMPFVVLNDWVASFNSANYVGRWWSKNTNARLSGWQRRQPAAYTFALRPYFRATYLMGSEAPQIDRYLGMTEDADFRWLIGPGLVVDGTYEWISVYGRITRLWTLGNGGTEIPGLTSEPFQLSVGIVLTPAWHRHPRLRLMGTALQWK